MDSRANPEGHTRRRYECARGHRFSTLELVAERVGQGFAERLAVVGAPAAAPETTSSSPWAVLDRFKLKGTR